MLSIIKIFQYLFRGKLQGVVYRKLSTDFFPKFIGFFSILFCRFIYPDIKIGENTIWWGRVNIAKDPESVVQLGKNTRIISDFTRAGIALYSRCKITVFGNAKVLIGSNVWLLGTSITCRTTTVEIGDGTIIAPNVIIVDSDFHTLWPPQNRAYDMGYEKDKKVVIGKNVWIGMNSIVLKGVTIGDNSVIAAGSIVTKDIPPNVVAGGNPARIIKPLP